LKGVVTQIIITAVSIFIVVFSPDTLPLMQERMGQTIISRKYRLIALGFNSMGGVNNFSGLLWKNVLLNLKAQFSCTRALGD
jgi:hypothetical protein